MGFLDKLKEGAGQAKDLAQQAAEKAKEEAKELSLKREMNDELQKLGQVTFDLVQSGALAHGDLAPGVHKIVDIKAQLAQLSGEGGSEAESSESTPPPAAE